MLTKVGKLSVADYLRCKVRDFGNGAALGAKKFVEGNFQYCRDRFGPKRKDGARLRPGVFG